MDSKNKQGGNHPPVFPPCGLTAAAAMTAAAAAKHVTLHW